MTDIVEYIPLILILAYIPFVCICDIKYRKMAWDYWIPLVAVNGYYLIQYLLQSPERNFYLLGVSVVLCLILLIMSYFGGFMGADWIFASLIILTIQYNPLVFPREFFALDFFWTLLITTCFVPIIVWAYNFKSGNLFGDEVISQSPYTFIEMLTKYPRGVPFMLVISFAFIATIVAEVLL